MIVFYYDYIAELSVTLHEKTIKTQLNMYGEIQNNKFYFSFQLELDFILQNRPE